MPDGTFKLIVGGVAIAVAGLIVLLRFCGDLALPAKPPAPTMAASQASDVMIASSATPAAWHAFLAKDAATAGVPAPSPDAMAKALPHKVDDKPRTLSPGDPPLEVAGLRLSLEVAAVDSDAASLILAIENLGETDLAYQVVTRPSVRGAACNSRDLLWYDANVVTARRRERRTECTYRDGLELHVERVETVELVPLSAWYVSRVPPSALNLDTRLTRGHQAMNKAPLCNVMMSQAIRSGLESGQIEWRDLVDFYARHRCDTYPFPKRYKAFRKDHEHQLPYVSDTR
jgi:hypothetical protein